MVNIALEQRPALPRIQGLGDKAGTGSQADLTGRRLTRPANGELRDFLEVSINLYSLKSTSYFLF